MGSIFSGTLTAAVDIAVVIFSSVSTAGVGSLAPSPFLSFYLTGLSAAIQYGDCQGYFSLFLSKVVNLKIAL